MDKSDCIVGQCVKCLFRPYAYERDGQADPAQCSVTALPCPGMARISEQRRESSAACATGNMDAKCYVCKSKNPRICFPSDNTMLRRMTAILLIKLRNFSMEMNVQNLHPTHPSQFQVMMSTSLALSSEPLKSTVGLGLCPSAWDQCLAITASLCLRARRWRGLRLTRDRLPQQARDCGLHGLSVGLMCDQSEHEPSDGSSQSDARIFLRRR